MNPQLFQQPAFDFDAEVTRRLAAKLNRRKHDTNYLERISWNPLQFEKFTNFNLISLTKQDNG